jgi:MerR family transcriptional regulator, redox-sensitive transcriptional activator SoxR
VSATPLRATDPLLPIGEVSRRTGLTISAIRYYEQRGLVGPLAREGGRRRFEPGAVYRLRVITEVQQAGFTLEEIRVLLGREGSGAQSRRPLVRRKLTEIQRDICRLQAIERALVTALGCGCDNLEHCRLPSLSKAAELPSSEE